MKHLLIASVALLPAWGPVMAQNSNDVRVRVGIGAQLEPDYIGADSTSVEPMFHINTARGTHEFSFGAPDDSPAISVVSSHGFSFGPAGDIQSRRENSDVGAPVGNVARTFEVGAFAQYEATDSFRVRAQLLKGINAAGGLIGTIGADKIWRNGDKYVFSVGPRLIISDGRYQRAYFGVTPAASLATGLPIYRPGGGVEAAGITSGMSCQLNSRWGLFGYARYERLVGDAAKSPIVRHFGSRNQLSGGIGLSYTFTLRQ